MNFVTLISLKKLKDSSKKNHRPTGAFWKCKPYWIFVFRSLHAHSAAMIYVLCTIKRMFGYHF